MGRIFWKCAIVIGNSLGAVVVVSAVLAVVCALSGPPVPNAKVTQVKIKGDQLIIQGNINSNMAKELHEILVAPHEKISKVLVSSGGGDVTSALNMAIELEKMGGHKTVVPADFECNSACLLLGIGLDNEFVPDDSATLLFHRGWISLGSETCWACKAYNFEENELEDAVYGNEHHRSMFLWANTLSPGLGDTITDCTPNPFDSRKGISITGLQFKAYRSGDRKSISCPSS